MKITQTKEAEKLILALEGRLDTTTAGELEAIIKGSNEAISELILDFASLDYVSSAGLRVILGAQKRINANKGKMLIRNVNETVMEVFSITGFVDILSIE